MRVVRDNLNAAIAESGKSSRGIAAEVPCHPSMIDHLRSGRRVTCTPGLAERIAEVLGTEMNSIFVPNLSPRTGRSGPSLGSREVAAK